MLPATLIRDGPLLVVASGRDTISVASSIKRLASQNVFVVQVPYAGLLLVGLSILLMTMNNFSYCFIYISPLIHYFRFNIQGRS